VRYRTQSTYVNIIRFYIYTQSLNSVNKSAEMVIPFTLTGNYIHPKTDELVRKCRVCL